MTIVHTSMKTFLSAAFLLLAMPAPPPMASEAAAGIAAPGRTAPETARKAVAAAAVLLRKGRYAEAHILLTSSARPDDTELELRRRFLLGMVYSRTGKPRRAIAQFERVLTVRADLTRARLELARAYFSVGDDDKADFHFQRALAAGLPSPIESRVSEFLSRIDARKRWNFSVTAAVLPESNPGRRTSADSVIIGGGRFRLSDDARESSGVGALLAGGVAYAPILSRSWRGHLAASASGRFYQESTFDQIAAIGEVGATKLFPGGNATGGLSLGHNWTGGDPLNWSIGPWTRLRARFTPKLSGRLELGAQALRYAESSRRDGWAYDVKPTIVYSLGERTYLDASLSLNIVEAEADHLGYRRLRGAINLTHLFDNGITLTGSASYGRRNATGEDPLFRQRRKDETFIVGGRALHRSFNLAGFAPYIEYYFEKTSSNLDLYSFDNHRLGLGVTRQF